MLQVFFRRIITPFYKPLLIHYLSKSRTFVNKPFKFIILPGVFHPAFFYSTKFLLQYIKQLDLNDKTLLEVGAGSGLISFHAALKAKKVVALELSKIALEGLLLNQKNNNKVLPVEVLQIVESDLFKALPKSDFDFIVVNPPYYPNKVKNETELAWNCGEEFEYFKQFFDQVSGYMNSKSSIIMVLSSQCNLNKITAIAINSGFTMQLKSTKKFLIENNYIFEITKNYTF